MHVTIGQPVLMFINACWSGTYYELENINMRVHFIAIVSPSRKLTNELLDSRYDLNIEGKKACYHGDGYQFVNS